jgi:prepilin peptidase CpaA
MLATVGACAYTDVRHGKVRNIVTLPAVLLGLTMNTILYGWAGLQQAAAGVGLALLLWVITGALGGCLGAGDVKLLGAIGALGGVTFLAAVLVVTVIAGGVMALALCLWQGKLRAALANVLQWALARMGLRPLGSSQPPTCGLTLPYALPIAAAVVLCLARDAWRVV